MLVRCSFLEQDFIAVHESFIIIILEEDSRIGSLIYRTERAKHKLRAAAPKISKRSPKYTKSSSASGPSSGGSSEAAAAVGLAAAAAARRDVYVRT